MSDGCIYCGRPVHRKSWFAVLRRHCLLRSMRWGLHAVHGRAVVMSLLLLPMAVALAVAAVGNVLRDVRDVFTRARNIGRRPGDRP